MLSTHLKNMLVKLDLFPKNRSKRVNKKNMFQTNHTLVKLDHFPAGFKPTEMILNAHPLPSDSSSNSAPGPANKEPANCAVFIVLLIADTFPKASAFSWARGVIHKTPRDFCFWRILNLKFSTFESITIKISIHRICWKFDAWYFFAFWGYSIRYSTYSFKISMQVF